MQTLDDDDDAATALGYFLLGTGGVGGGSHDDEGGGSHDVEGGLACDGIPGVGGGMVT